MSNILVDILGEIVDTLRATGTITNLSEASGITTVTSVNSLSVNEVVTMDSVDYVILSASSSQFTVTGTGLTASLWAAKAPYYDYGHPMEIFNTLTEKDEDDTLSYQKYPLIYLWMDFDRDVTVNARVKNITAEDLIIVIMTQTEPDYKAANRYDSVFTPTLTPLYDSLMSALLNSPLVSSNDKYHHKSIDKLYWGKEDEYGNVSNIGNDFLDAVIIRGLDLIIECNN